MFLEILSQSGARDGRFQQLVYYLERHVELDGDTHGPLAQQMLEALCGGNQTCIREAIEAAQQALRARIALWDGIAERLGAAAPENHAELALA